MRGRRSAIVIRALRPDDLNALFDVTERTLGAEWLEQHLRGDFYIAVVDVGGVPVGRRCLDFTFYAEERAAYGFGAVVLKQWRSRGLGSMLDDHSEEIALARGLRAIRCSVEKANTRAKAWHDSLGYRCIGESVRRWADGSGREVVADCWELERPLDVPLRPLPRWRRRRRQRLRRRGMRPRRSWRRAGGTPG